MKNRWALENKRFGVIAKYSLLFVIAAIVTFGYFVVNKKSFVWHLDGLEQHNLALSYYGSWLRQIVKNIFVEHTFTVPMWNFSIGYGADIITTLNYYVLGEPLNLLSIFVTPKYTEYLYGALIIIRLYLSGLAFISFCKIMNQRGNGVVVGAVAYVFTTYTMFAAVRHPFFVLPMIFFPLLLGGVEKILKGGKPYQFIFVIIFSAISNFYFFYMMVFLTVIYAVIRCGFLHGKKISASVKKLGSMLLYSIVAVMISAILFLPVILFFIGDNRHGVDYTLSLFYDAEYYQQLFSELISAQVNSTWNAMGYTPVALLGLFFCFKKKNKQQFVFLFVSIFILISPIMGSFMNGGSYVSNRWLWAFALLCSYLIVDYWEEILNICVTNVKPVFVYLAVYTFFICFMKNARTLNAMMELAPILLLVIYLIVFHQSFRYKKECAVAVTVIFGIAINGYFMYSFHQGNYISEFIDSGQVYKTYQETQSSDIKNEVKDNAFFRFSSESEEFDNTKNSRKNTILRTGIASSMSKADMSVKSIDNSALLFSVNGIGFYWSLQNSHISDYLLNTEAREYPTYMYHGIDNRAGLLSLSSVKYYISEKGNENVVPYGFEKIKTIKKKAPYTYRYKNGKNTKTIYYLYENKFALPLGYTYDGFVSEKDIAGYNGIEKEELMLQSAVLEDASNTDIQKTAFSSKKLDYQVECYEGVTYQDHQFVVMQSNAGVVLHFNSSPNSGLYATVKNLNMKFQNPLDQFEKQLDSFSRAEQNLLKSKNEFWSEPVSGNIYFSDEYVYTRLMQLTDVDGLYNGKEDYVINLGYNKNSRYSVVLKFDKPGIYSFDELNIVEQSYDKYEEKIENLKEDVLSDVTMKDNEINGTINLDKEKLLVLTIPYSKGWTAYVDGKEYETEKVNYMYTGIFLEEGEHEIRLSYCTPGIKAGAVVSLIGVLGLLIIVCIDRYRTGKSAR